MYTDTVSFAKLKLTFIKTDSSTIVVVISGRYQSKLIRIWRLFSNVLFLYVLYGIGKRLMLIGNVNNLEIAKQKSLRHIIYRFFGPPLVQIACLLPNTLLLNANACY